MKGGGAHGKLFFDLPKLFECPSSNSASTIFLLNDDTLKIADRRYIKLIAPNSSTFRQELVLELPVPVVQLSCDESGFAFE